MNPRFCLRNFEQVLELPFFLNKLKILFLILFTCSNLHSNFYKRKKQTTLVKIFTLCNDIYQQYHIYVLDLT